MKRKQHCATGLIALVLCVCLVGGTAVPAHAFTFTASSKWDVGVNTATNNLAFYGSPGGATWSVMGAGFTDVSTFDNNHVGFSTAAITSLNVAGWGVAQYETMFDWALDTWAAASGFSNLGQVADGGVNVGAAEPAGGLGDIRIAAWGNPNAITLAEAWNPGNEAIFGAGGSIAGDAHFDVGWTWVDNGADITGNGVFDLSTVVLHEFGHSLGLGHSGVAGSLMDPIYQGGHRWLHADDIAGIQAIYGGGVDDPIPEPGTLVLFGTGLLGAAGFVRRRFNV